MSKRETIQTAAVEHKHGSNFYVARTAAGVYSQVAAYCRDYWDEVEPVSDGKNDDGQEASVAAPPADWTDEQIVSHYFDNHDIESVTFGTALLED